MIIGIGTDIIEVQRIKDVTERRGERFLQRIFTPLEIEYCSPKKNAALHFAGRFAAKESAFKAMERGWGGQVNWKEVEIYNEPSGAPRLRFYGKAQEIIQEKKITGTFVTISHVDEYATAVVILEG